MLVACESKKLNNDEMGKETKFCNERHLYLSFDNSSKISSVETNIESNENCKNSIQDCLSFDPLDAENEKLSDNLKPRIDSSQKSIKISPKSFKENHDMPEKPTIQEVNMCPSTYSNTGDFEILDNKNFGYLNRISLDVFSYEKVPYNTVIKPSKCRQVSQELPIFGVKTSIKNASLNDHTEKCKNTIPMGPNCGLNITGNSPPNYDQKIGNKTSENMIPLSHKIGLESKLVENGLHCGKIKADLAEILGENDPLLIPLKPRNNSIDDQVLDIQCSNEKLDVIVEDSESQIYPKHRIMLTKVPPLRQNWSLEA